MGSSAVKMGGKGKAKGKSGGKGSMPKEPANLPKPPANAYFMFGSYIRSQPGGPKGLKEVQQAWVQLGAEGQKKYVEQAEAAKKQYEEDMAAFRKTVEGKKHLRLKQGAEKKLTLQ